MRTGLTGFVVDRGLDKGHRPGAMQQFAFGQHRGSALGRPEKTGLHFDGDGPMVRLHTAGRLSHGGVHQRHQNAAVDLAKNIQVFRPRAVPNCGVTSLKVQELKRSGYLPF